MDGLTKADLPAAVEENYLSWYHRVSHPFVVPPSLPGQNEQLLVDGVVNYHTILKNALKLDVVKRVGQSLASKIMKAIKALTDIPCYKPPSDLIDEEPQRESQLVIKEPGENPQPAHERYVRQSRKRKEKGKGPATKQTRTTAE